MLSYASEYAACANNLLHAIINNSLRIVFSKFCHTDRGRGHRRPTTREYTREHNSRSRSPTRSKVPEENPHLPTENLSATSGVEMAQVRKPVQFALYASGLTSEMSQNVQHASYGTEAKPGVDGTKKVESSIPWDRFCASTGNAQKDAHLETTTNAASARAVENRIKALNSALVLRKNWYAHAIWCWSMGKTFTLLQSPRQIIP